MTNKFQRLPSVDRVLQDESLRRAAAELGPAMATEAVRAELAHRRNALAAGDGDFSFEEVVASAVERAYASIRTSLRRVINATGVIIHTNLGRAPLSEATLAAMVAAGRGYSNLEYDHESGERGSRQDHLAPLLRELTGAEAALVVNNNAAAVLLAAAALAEGRDVLVSRGELVEIGDGFRIPEVLARSGARLVEVGATNRTRLADYERAIGERTALILRVHQSNFRVVGFTEETPLAELARLAEERDLVLVDDLGSGVLSRIAGWMSEKRSVLKMRV